jgi:Glycosyl hydrolase family 9/Cellulase N-terminal ig-like domain
MTSRPFRRILALGAFGLTISAPTFAVDNGTQMDSPFRINYLGYFANGDKIALFLSPTGGSKAWLLVDAAGKAVASGTSTDYVKDDFASGDSFFRVDFSSYRGTGTGFRLNVDGQRSQPFDLTTGTPYGGLTDASFGYFKDHRTPDYTFDHFLNNWTTGRIQGPFWNDAGDKGFYTTNTALAGWVLMNLLERYPDANGPFANGVTLDDELQVGMDLMHKVILPGQKLAIAKLHTNVPRWGPCPPHAGGPDTSCISKPETKSTFAVARTLAQLARIHRAHQRPDAAKTDFAAARTALGNAQSEPKVCLDYKDFGGEGGIYPDNDNYGLWREPKANRDPCHPDRDNIEDDAYAALVEVALTAKLLGDPEASTLLTQVQQHSRFGEVSEFWWAAVAAMGNVSLLTLKPEGVDLAPVRANLFRYVDDCIRQMAVGYPGVTKDVRSDRWKSGDKDDVDSNWRWGSNRLILDDAILMAIAAEEKQAIGDREAAGRYARHALRVMDYLLGTNAMALSMITGFGENAVERTHDCCVPNTRPGKMALGPNNWTNASDPAMPPFGSLPGMKMMPKKGTGWAAREVDIDANAPLVWMSWWAEHKATALLAVTAAGPEPSGARPRVRP